MATVLRPVAHEDKLSLVEHLDELRTRLIVGLVAYLACFAVCFWQNDAVLRVVNRPFHVATEHSKAHGALANSQRNLAAMAADAEALAKSLAASGQDSGVRDAASKLAASAGKVA